MITRPEAEDSTITCSFVWTKHRNVTNRQTDRQTTCIVTAVCIASNAARNADRTRCKMKNQPNLTKKSHAVSTQAVSYGHLE